MADTYQAPVVERKALMAKPQPDTNREQLRAEINARYGNTLNYLGR